MYLLSATPALEGSGGATIAPDRRQARDDLPRAARILYRLRENRDGEDLLELFNEKTFVEGAATREAFASSNELNCRLDNIVARRKCEIVARLEGRAVGLGGLYALGDRLSHTAWLLLGVRKELRRQGVGSTLLRLLLASAKHMEGLTKVQLTVFVDNAAAIRVYERAGFEIEGLHRRFVRRPDGYVDGYSMAVFLEESASPRAGSAGFGPSSSVFVL